MAAYMKQILINQLSCKVLLGRCSKSLHQKQALQFSACIRHQQVATEKYGSVQMIAINRPEKRNAVDPSTAEELYKAFKEFDEDETMTAAVLYGKGGMFCSGMDLSVVATANETGYMDWCDAEQRGPMGPTRYQSSKPVIAAVEGYAVAGGMELALWCDMRVMDESAVMGIFCRRFGVPLIDGGTFRLPALIGLSRAMDLILTGREIKAKEALEWGLANRVCDTGSVVGRAVSLAMEISKFPQMCMKTDRASAYYGAYSATSFEDALKAEWNRGKPVVEAEAIHGAGRFVSGVGRHGSYNLHKVQSDKDGEN